MFTGKSLVIGGSRQVNQLSQKSNSFYGDVSAVLLSNLPWWAQLVRTPSLDIAMDEWKKIRKNDAFLCPGECYRYLGSSLGLWFCEKILNEKKVESILDIWPNLEVFSTVQWLLDLMSINSRLIPSTGMNYIETYNASEGFL